MFRSRTDSGHNPVIPTQFVWPYGGTRVFLTGSFTGWSEHILMSPMEGCATVFQAICNLTPGYHQYKFNVDGQWHHDDHQAFVSGSYGVVNTRFMARDDLVTVMFNTAAPGRSNMDVDDATFDRMATVSDGISHGAVPRVSEADIETQVVALDVNLPVKQAFHVLYEQGIPIAPLWDFSKGQFVGVLSSSDFILILRQLRTLGSNLTEEELETHTILAWKDGKAHMNGHIDNNERMSQRGLVHAGPYDSLKDVALKILLNKVSTIPIIHSSSPDGSSPQLLHLASLSGILKCICRHFKHSSSSLPVLQQPICSIQLGTWVPKIGEANGHPFAMLRQHSSLGAALSLLVQAEVSSVPIVDDNHSLIDVYSRSDITSLAKDTAYAHIHPDEMSIHQALKLEQDVSSSQGTFNGQKCHMCLPSDPLQKVMERLANPGVRRLVIVEAGSKRVEGIITLSDVFRFLLR